METSPGILILLLVGLLSGLFSGFFGIGGGVLIVPALVYLIGFSQHKAIGTSLAVLLPPVGLAAVLAYYRAGNVDLRAAMLIAVGLFLGGGVGAAIAGKVPSPYLRMAFGVFVLCLGGYIVYGALKHAP